MSIQLNRAEERVFLAVEEFSRQAHAPTIRDLYDATGIKSPGQVHLALKSLTNHGLIIRERGKARSPRPAGPTGPRVRGTITSGGPLELLPAVEHHSLDLAIHADEGAGVYALRVRDNSLAPGHVQVGDYLIVRPAAEPRDGDLILATCRRRTLLARYSHQSDPGRIRLEPMGAEPAIHVRADAWARDWTVLGCVAAVYRPLDMGVASAESAIAEQVSPSSPAKTARSARSAAAREAA